MGPEPSTLTAPPVTLTAPPVNIDGDAIYRQAVLAMAAATEAAEATEAWDDDTSATGGSADIAAPGGVRSVSMVA